MYPFIINQHTIDCTIMYCQHINHRKSLVTNEPQMLSGSVINVCISSQCGMGWGLFWVALFQSMTQNTEVSVSEAIFPKLFISCPVHGKERQEGAPTFSYPRAESHASSFSFISLKAIIWASVWYDRKLGPGVFSFNCFPVPRRLMSPKPILAVGC